MSERGDKEFLQGTLEAAKRILEYCDELSYEQFLEDNKTQDAVIRTQIPWIDFAKVRDKFDSSLFWR